MEKQKICIIGGGLTGLITAITLSKIGLNIDLITGDIDQNIKSNRTIAISQNNYFFLKKLNIFKFSKKEFWPSFKMKLYVDDQKEKFTEIFALNSNKRQILYMMENSKIIKHMIRNINQKKIISFKTRKTISEIIPSGFLKSVKFKNKVNSKYNLVIICAGSNSNLVKNYFNNQSYERSYKEISITTTLQHKALKNNIVRQIFLDDEIIALLPMSNTRTSIVWSIKKNIMNKYKNKQDLLLKQRIKFYTRNFLSKIKFISNIEYRNLNLLIRKKYYQDRVLLFGDALHEVHPLVGQGFNMMLRDLISLEKTLKSKINLGLDIGSTDVLSEFSHKTKPSNFIYTLGIDFIKKFFSLKEKNLKNFRNKIIIKLNKSNFAKNLFFDFADKGLKL